MKVFIEWLWCPCGIARIGKASDSYGKPFEYAVVVAVPWRSVFWWLLGGTAEVTIKALAVPEEDRGKSIQAPAKVLFRELKRLRMLPDWERFENES